MCACVEGSKGAHLQRAEGLGKGWHPDQVGGNDDGRGVVRTVVTLDSHVSCNERNCLGGFPPVLGQAADCMVLKDEQQT